MTEFNAFNLVAPSTQGFSWDVESTPSSQPVDTEDEAASSSAVSSIATQALNIASPDRTQVDSDAQPHKKRSYRKPGVITAGFEHDFPKLKRGTPEYKRERDKWAKRTRIIAQMGNEMLSASSAKRTKTSEDADVEDQTELNAKIEALSEQSLAKDQEIARLSAELQSMAPALQARDEQIAQLSRRIEVLEYDKKFLLTNVKQLDKTFLLSTTHLSKIIRQFENPNASPLGLV